MSVPPIGPAPAAPAVVPAAPAAATAAAELRDAMETTYLAPVSAVDGAGTPPMAAVPPMPVESAIGASEPLPIPEGVPVQRSPQNTEPPVASERPTPISDLNHISATPVAPHPAPAPAPVGPDATVPAAPPAAAPSTVAHAAAEPGAAEPDSGNSRVAGGTLPPPIVDVEDAPNPSTPDVKVAAPVQKKADRYGIDIDTIAGTGKGGKVIGRDVDAAIAAKAAASEVIAEDAAAVPAASVEPTPTLPTEAAARTAPAEEVNEEDSTVTVPTSTPPVAAAPPVVAAPPVTGPQLTTASPVEAEQPVTAAQPHTVTTDQSWPEFSLHTIKLRNSISVTDINALMDKVHDMIPNTLIHDMRIVPDSPIGAALVGPTSNVMAVEL